MRARRMASSDRSTRCSDGPALAVWPSLKIRYRTWSTERSRSRRSSVGGMANPTPEARMRPFARLMRWAIVASGIMNARAISAVVRPPTARSVSGMADAGGSAGWQHRKRRSSESSSSATDERRGCRLTAGDEALALHPGAVRPPGIDQAARRAARQPAEWLVRDAGARPPVGGGDERLLDRIFRGVEIAVSAGE